MNCSKYIQLFIIFLQPFFLGNVIIITHRNVMAFPFHYAFKVKNLELIRQFFIDILGCHEGRSSNHWMDFDFFTHQFSTHISDSISKLNFCRRLMISELRFLILVVWYR